MKYRKKPVVIEAIQYRDGGDIPLATKFCSTAISQINEDTLETRLVIPTLEGDLIVSRGDWIIKGIKGEFYPCKPDIFEATYEKVEEDK